MEIVMFDVPFLRNYCSQRFKWAGHLARMDENCCCKKIVLAKPMGNRPRGRPPLRWIDNVEKDLNILKVKNSCQEQRCLDKTSGEGQDPPMSVERLKKGMCDGLVVVLVT
ncbi:hypothetical protein TNCV_2807911 [Trichonephila clavipes]|nr:hypothetical protein TNCV_2807911 [Trichonephila clavipes]